MATYNSMQKVKFYRLTKAFCLGETRQHITEAQLTATCRNWSFTSFFKAISRAFPSTTNASGEPLLCSSCITSLKLSSWCKMSSFIA